MKTKQEIEEEAEKFAKDWEGFALVREGMKDGFIAGAKFMQAYADQQCKDVLDEAIAKINGRALSGLWTKSEFIAILESLK